MNGTKHGPGWWLPEPRAKFDAPASAERTARFRFFGAMAVRLWLVISIAFGGLLHYGGTLNWGQQFFGTLLFAATTGTLVLVLMALAWCSS